MSDRWRLRRPAAGLLAAALALLAGAAPALALDVDVTDPPYSAVGNGVANDRVAIQTAIDDVHGAGGGTVTIPAGRTFLSGGIRILSDVMLALDGTLLQSQDVAHYATAPTLGKNMPTRIQWDHAWFHNDPFVYAGGASDVTLTGSGAIEMTRARTGLADTVHAVPIGFQSVEDYVIENVDVLEANNYNVALYGTRRGVVRNLVIRSNPASTNTDGIGLINSQHVRVTGNTLEVGDDGLYASVRLNDPRDYDPRSWWTQRTRQPTHHIEFDNNDVDAGCCKAFTLAPRISGASDLRDVAVTDIDVHDNVLEAGEAVGCWHAELAPMTRIRIEDNVYIGRPASPTLPDCVVTDFVNDLGMPSSRVLRNAGFETTGDAWWSPGGDAGAAPVGDRALDPAAQTASTAFSGFVGYIQDLAQPAELLQGISFSEEVVPAALALPSPLDRLFAPNGVVLSADVVTSGDPARLVAYNGCDGRLLGAQTVTNTAKARRSLAFSMPAGCAEVRVGIDGGSATSGWALIDDVAIEATSDGEVIDDNDLAQVAYTGTWSLYTNAPERDVQATRHVGRAAGSTATVSFDGTRGWIVSNTSPRLGIAEVWLDGVLDRTIDLYSPSLVHPLVTYDTGVLADGRHTIRLVQTGLKNRASDNIYIGLDALLFDPGP